MKQKLLLRLDDAADRMDVEKWQRMENLLDKYNIKPLVGVIPDCQDPMMMKYEKDGAFWDKVHRWIEKEWTIALHGYRHVYDSNDGGINPVNTFSEFAGHSCEEQAKRIRDGIRILRAHGVEPNVFFAPGHTFDKSTLKAIKDETNIRVISDTIAWDAYKESDFAFIPVQSGRVRKLPFKTVTYCYHPNTMTDTDFFKLEKFLMTHSKHFSTVIDAKDTKRRYSFVDKVFSKIYFSRRKK